MTQLWHVSIECLPECTIKYLQGKERSDDRRKRRYGDSVHFGARTSGKGFQVAVTEVCRKNHLQKPAHGTVELTTCMGDGYFSMVTATMMMRYRSMDQRQTIGNEYKSKPHPGFHAAKI